ncbi:outer membrane protein transport protein [Parendozoicomonas sp. Alg238-R29]|uniref:outer membrane protein transport protein n=1 Tax=Parendozoicomonas sp. Alg238-R29 TaxID=2993446 RepID=UPI00248F0503|nr:outer membrane protein transport protein [Parendozoicomonas sp. Alg238-R29]
MQNYKLSTSLLFKRSVALGLAAVLCLAAITAHAQLAQNLTIGSPKAMALANAVTADFVGMDNVHYNPAALTKLKGRQIETKLFGGYMDIRAKFDAPPDYGFFGYDADDDPVVGKTSRANTPVMFIPGFGMIDVPVLFAPLNGISFSPPGSKFTFANNLYAPMALGFKRSGDDPGRFQGEELALQRITYLSPSIAYQVNDKLSVGLSIGFSHQAMGIQQDMRTPNDLVALTGNDAIQELACGIPGVDIFVGIFLYICSGEIGPFQSIGEMTIEMEERLSPTYNIGFQWEPYDWLRVGAVYQSGAEMSLSGNYAMKYDKGFYDFIQGFTGQRGLPSVFGQALVGTTSGKIEETGKAYLDMEYPAHFAIGASIDLTPKLTVNLDAKWTDWDVWDEFKIEFDRELAAMQFARILAPGQVSAAPTYLSMPRGYKSVWSWAVGMEYDYTSRLSLRAGYENRPSAIPEDRADVMAPLGDAHLIGLGFGYQWDKESVVDVGFQYMWSDQKIPAGTSCNANCDGLTDVIYNPYAGLDIETSVRAYIFSLTYRTRF